MCVCFMCLHVWVCDREKQRDGQKNKDFQLPAAIIAVHYTATNPQLLPTRACNRVDMPPKWKQKTRRPD